MAKDWIGFEDKALGENPSGFTSRWASPNTGTEIVSTSAEGLDINQQSQLGDKAWKFQRSSSGAPRVAFEKDFMTGTAEDEIEGLIYLNGNNNARIGALVLRGSGASEAARSGYVLYVRLTSGLFEIRRTVSGSETVVASGTANYGGHGILRVRYTAAENTSGHLVLSAEVYPYDDPSLKTVLSYTDTTKLPKGWLGVGSVNLSTLGVLIYWGWVGFGTDGDPAPTGPVGVSAEPFRLRHNPRTNKVIPVLSFPTVTDIGATCVRPRVTKGF